MADLFVAPVAHIERAFGPQARASIGGKSERTEMRGLFLANSIKGVAGGDDARLYFAHPNPDVRAWAVWSLMNVTAIDEDIPQRLVALARDDKSPAVRREVASLLQRLPTDKRAEIAMALLARKEDAEDHNIPLLVWYGIEPLVGEQPNAGLELARTSTWEKITAFIYRRLAVTAGGRETLLATISNMSDPAQRDKTLRMVVDNARLNGKLDQPKEWAATAAKLKESFGAGQGSAALVDELSATFGDAAAIVQFRETLANTQIAGPGREAALSVLLQVRDPGTAKLCQAIVKTEKQSSALKRKSIEALASLADAETGSVLVARYSGLSNEEKVDALSTMASCRDGAVAMLNAVAENGIPQQALSPFLIR